MVGYRGRASTQRSLVVALLVLLLVSSAGLLTVAPARAASGNYPPLTGSVNGPTVLALNGTSRYFLNATGGPAYAPNGTLIGNLTFYASIVAGNTSGISVSPSFGAIPNASYPVVLSVNAVTQVVDLDVEYASVYRSENVSINITYQIHVTAPYVLTGEIQAGNQTVTDLSIQVSLDDVVVGSISIPTLTPKEDYNFTYDYVVVSLSSGYHTFTLTLPTQHGQVHFANGALSYSYTFYISGPAPSYTLYYVLGAVALVGVILIFLFLVGARRRGGSRS